MTEEIKPEDAPGLADEPEEGHTVVDANLADIYRDQAKRLAAEASDSAQDAAPTQASDSADDRAPTEAEAGPIDSPGQEAPAAPGPTGTDRFGTVDPPDEMVPARPKTTPPVQPAPPTDPSILGDAFGPPAPPSRGTEQIEALDLSPVEPPPSTANLPDAFGDPVAPPPAVARTSPTGEIPAVQTGISSIKERPPEPSQPRGPSVDDLWNSSGSYKTIEEEGSATKSKREIPAVSKGAKKSKPEYSRKQTNVYKDGKAVQPEEATARLVCVTGKDKGSEFPVSGASVTVGRDPRNGVVLKELSASREHARIESKGTKFRLVDLGSGNGTFINGERISKSRLSSGDEVGFGNGVYRFLEVGDVFKPLDSRGSPVLPGARRNVFAGGRGMLVAGALVLVAALGAVTVLLVRASRNEASLVAAFDYYSQGIKAFKARQWAEAEDHFKIMTALVPTHPRGRAYLQAVRLERRAEGKLAEARNARSAGQLLKANAAVAEIHNSVYADDARTLMRGIETELDAQVSRAKTALKNGEAAEALTLLTTVEKIRPGRPDVAALIDRAKRSLGPKAASIEARASNPPLDPLAQARVSIGNGKLRDAQDLLNRQKSREAKKLIEAINDFATIYTKAREQHRIKASEQALKLLAEAAKAEQKMTGGTTRLSEEIQRKIADMHYIDGVAAIEKGDLSAGAKHLQEAKRTYTAHRMTQARLDELAARTDEILSQGQAAEEAGNIAKAKSLYQTVVLVGRPTDDSYEQASLRLSDLQ